ncbi:MAG: hypothetical protein M3460_28880 [Actinomycetota bacterium]|nr:hypothetical protein [Actinomycetota bacterium]
MPNPHCPVTPQVTAVDGRFGTHRLAGTGPVAQLDLLRGRQRSEQDRWLLRLVCQPELSVPHAICPSRLTLARVGALRGPLAQGGTVRRFLESLRGTFGDGNAGPTATRVGGRSRAVLVMTGERLWDWFVLLL